MNKQEYLERLEACLRHKLSREEIDDIMRDYAEYFEEGRRQSKQDSEISAKLGDPELVAQQLIEESQEQNAEYYSSARPKSKEKKMPWDSAGNCWKSLKSRFQEWDHGDAGASSSQEEEETGPEEQTQEQEKLAAEAKAQQQKSGKKGQDSVLVRIGRSVVRGCRWCLYAMIALFLAFVAAMISAGLVFLSAALEGTLVFTLAAGVISLLVAVFGIILSGFAFAFFGTWSGIAVLSGSIAGIGLSALASFLLYQGIVKFWKFFVKGFGVGVRLWSRMLHKFESWLIVPKTKTAPKQEPEQPNREEQVNAANLLPMNIPVPAETDEDNTEAGKEGC